MATFIRPEHAMLTRDGAAAMLNGKLENIVYFGTDTHYHLKLADGAPFTVRTQNSRNHDASFAKDEQVGIAIDQNAVQVLRD